MKRTYLVLKDLINLLDGEEYVNLYDATGFTLYIKVRDIPEEYLEQKVIKFKNDRALPSLHFKLESVC